MPRSQGYIIEFYKVGSYVKVSAIDPVTSIETFITAPSSGVSKLYLEQLAIKKLETIIKRKSK